MATLSASSQRDWLSSDGAEVELASRLTRETLGLPRERRRLALDGCACSRCPTGSIVSVSPDADREGCNSSRGVAPRSRSTTTARESLFAPAELGDTPLPEPAAALARRVDPGPGYSREKTLTFVRNRYARCREILACTLPRLAADPDFQLNL